MGASISFDQITETIRSQFRYGPPNGWLLGWDESRCFALVSAAAAPYPTTNHTSFDYEFCNSFESHIASGDGPRHWTLTIKLSFVVPCYSVHWTRYQNAAHGSVIPAAPVGRQDVEDKVRDALEKSGFFELPLAWHDREIQGVRLELSGTENVTLSKCLLSDYEG